jgi:peptide/nickel transport system permease protein
MSTADRTPGVAVTGTTPHRSSRGLWRRFRHHRLALLGLAIVVVLGLGAAFAPWIAIHDPNSVDLDSIKKAPNASHILGTDSAGRDVFARILFAARVSMSVGLVAVGIASVIGTNMGLVSGYAGGWIDNLLMRFTELVMTFPLFFAVVILVAMVGPSVFNIMTVIGVLGWTGIARLVRGQVLSLREMDYVTAARAVGGSDRRLIFVHILPGVLPYVAVAATLLLAGAILTEAALSFLGLGVQIPTPTWGNMMTAAQSLYVLENQPWLWAPPGIAIGLMVLAVNFVGDGLRDALDPRAVIQ